MKTVVGEEVETSQNPVNTACQVFKTFVTKLLGIGGNELTSRALEAVAMTSADGGTSEAENTVQTNTITMSLFIDSLLAHAVTTSFL